MEKIDWEYWLKRKSLLEVEVALLTLGFDPDNHQIGYLAGERYLVDEGRLQALQKDFNRRMTFIQENRFTPYEYMADDGEWGDYFSANNDKVLVKRFLLWLKNEDMGWKLPPEMTKFIGGLSAQESVKPKSKGRPKSLSEEEEKKLIETYNQNPKLSQDSLADMFKISRNTAGNTLRKHGKK